MVGARRYEIRRAAGQWQAGAWVDTGPLEVFHVTGCLRPAGDRLQLLAASGAIPAQTRATFYADPSQPALRAAVQGTDLAADRIVVEDREYVVIGETPHQGAGGVPHRLYLLAEIAPPRAEVLP